MVLSTGTPLDFEGTCVSKFAWFACAIAPLIALTQDLLLVVDKHETCQISGLVLPSGLLHLGLFGRSGWVPRLLGRRSCCSRFVRWCTGPGLQHPVNISPAWLMWVHWVRRWATISCSKDLKFPPIRTCLLQEAQTSSQNAAWIQGYGVSWLGWRTCRQTFWRPEGELLQPWPRHCEILVGSSSTILRTISCSPRESPGSHPTKLQGVAPLTGLVCGSWPPSCPGTASGTSEFARGCTWWPGPVSCSDEPPTVGESRELSLMSGVPLGSLSGRSQSFDSPPLESSEEVPVLAKLESPLETKKSK